MSNTPQGFNDPANNETVFEPTLAQFNELVWKFIDSNRSDFIAYIESQAGETNQQLINEWIDCDVSENVNL